MNDLIIKSFKGKAVLSLLWNNKPCWIASDIADICGYTNLSKAIFKCTNAESFKKGIEYEVLEGYRLKTFKEVFSEQLGDSKFAAKIVIFYEEGLYGFLSYTQMPIGVEFRTWIRREIMPSFSRSEYTLKNKKEVKNLSVEIKSFNFDKFSSEEMERYRIAFETAKMFEPILDKITKDSTYKFLYLKKIFLNAGIEFPQYIEEEKFKK